MTRGPHSPAVYWRRRLVLLAIVAGLVIGCARLFGGGDAPDQAQQVSAQQSPDASAGATSPSADAAGATVTVAAQADGTTTTVAEEGTGSATSGTTSASRAGKKARTATPTPTPTPVQPAGRCEPADVLATPVVGTAVAGTDVTFTVELRTVENPGCWFTVKPGSLALKVSTESGGDVWTTSQCRAAVPHQEVAVRSAEAADVQVTWGGRYSDASCSVSTEWAAPGAYTVEAAALGGEVRSATFSLSTP
ncbi:hypothetical protein [Nocardioides sp. GY 10127]|uniref:hypothetical protein n=1 Tax=Nocardioides sp. GY 10127 TaxID=2569762 RepID=UPI0010A7DE54|nr:hypothetical protein [Nocardioides sp. GY 10127]TIC79404.1 hypothetical protein E8D37_17640 [Nocardioides sp. GY 10127]